MKDCLLTIVMPSYNIQDYVSKGLESFQQVQSDYKNKFEVLVVNDGSTDDTAKVAEEILAKDSFDGWPCHYKRKWWSWFNYQSRYSRSKGKIFLK